MILAQQLASVLALSGGLLYASPGQVDVPSLRGVLPDVGEVSTRQVSDDRQSWAEVAASRSDVTILVGWERVSDATLGWLDRERVRLQRPGRIFLLVLADDDLARILRRATHLKSMMSRLEAAPVITPTTSLVAAADIIAASGALRIDPADEALVDALAQRRMAGWTTRPLKRRSAG